MDDVNRLLDASLRALLVNAKRDGLREPFRVVVIDGEGTAIPQNHAPGTEIAFPVRMALVDADGRKAEILVEAEPPQPGRVN